MFDGLLQFVACRIRNRRMPNGTYGGVRGRKMKVGGNDYIIFLLLDLIMSIPAFTSKGFLVTVFCPSNLKKISIITKLY